jgi:hypothetical protein
MRKPAGFRSVLLPKSGELGASSGELGASSGELMRPSSLLEDISRLLVRSRPPMDGSGPFSPGKQAASGWRLSTLNYQFIRNSFSRN